MEKFDEKKYQTAQLEIISAVAEKCDELGITYYAVGGTLLGAVRHGGFIPWDCDIDIALKRADYERLRKYYAEHGDDELFFDDYISEPNHLSPHALIRKKGTHVHFKTRVSEKYKPKYDGIYLDVFPLDEAPADEKLRKKQMSKIKRLRRLVEYKAGYVYTDTGMCKKILKKIVGACLGVFSMQGIQRRLDETMRKYNGCGSGYLVSMASRYSYEKQIMPLAVYGTPTTVKFEGRELSAPAIPDEWLRRIYGDYMTPPPENKRHDVFELIADVDYGENNDR